MPKKIAEDIFAEIKLKNEQKGLKSIPHSDEFLSFIVSNLGIDKDKARQMIKILIDSHKIFAIEIVAEDREKNIPRVEGYIEASLPIITRLKHIFQDELVKMYDNEFYKRVPYHKAVKEIFPIIRSLNNTPIGQIANKAIMLGELEKSLEKNFNEYTDGWKEKHFKFELDKISSKKDHPDRAPEKEIGYKRSERAVDSKNYEDFISKSKGYPIDRILKIYGTDFVFRVHIRNYKFSYLIEIVEKGNILTKKDLLKLRDILHAIKLNFQKDPKLVKHTDEIHSLDRAVSHGIYFTGFDG